MVFSAAVLAIDTLTLIATTNTRIETFTVLLITMGFATATTTPIDSPLYIIHSPLLYLFVNMTIKTVRIPVKHLLNSLFSFLFVTRIVVTSQAIALTITIPTILEAFTI